jgi:hypothetical protein
MPVRGTTVALHSKEVIVRERDGRQGTRILCAWADCDNTGYDCHKITLNDAKPGFAPKYINYVFCSENCRSYFARSHVPGEYGKLGAGLRSRYM